MWPYTHELFEVDEMTTRLVAAGVAVDPAGLRPGWQRHVERVLREATLVQPSGGWRPTGGRAGRHTEAMGYLLAELQHLHRSLPAVAW